MTTEIEKQFFETFGIKPEYKTCIFKYCKNKKEYDCENCNDREWHYPEITDKILLELICIANRKYAYVEIVGPDVETMKNNLLEYFIFFRRDVKKYIQKLFKEEND